MLERDRHHRLIGWRWSRWFLVALWLGAVLSVTAFVPACSTSAVAGGTAGAPGADALPEAPAGDVATPAPDGRAPEIAGTADTEVAGPDGPMLPPGDAAAEPVGDGSQPAGPDLKVMTFNIRYANPGDGANAWPNRRDQVFALLREQAPDSAGLQEALNTQVQDLSTALPEYRRIGVGRDDGVSAGEFSPIFYRLDRFEVAASSTFWFSDTPDVPGSSSWGNASIRICTWARFVEKRTGRAYYHFNVHLDNVSQPANEKSVQLLMKRIVERSVPSDPFIVTGDFNSGESQPAVQYMTGAASIGGMPNPIPLVDSFRALYPTATGVGTFHDFTGATAGDKIDFIFLGPGEKAVSASIDHRQQNGRYPSDHFPVTAAIDIAN